MTHPIRQRLYDAAHAFGYTVVPNWRVQRNSQSLYLQKLFRLLDIDSVLDVGANRGQYRDFLRSEVGFRGNIISFEPIPAHAEAMRERAKEDPLWSVEQCALGAASGTATFNVMASTTFSSFLQPKGSEPLFKSSNDIRERVEVQMRTLDEFLPFAQSLGAKNTYLKLDTQGFDLEVVRGAVKYMESVRALQTEVAVRPLYEGMPTFATVFQMLHDRGFEPSGIYPNNEGHFPLLYEFDFHMISRRFCKT